MLWLLVPVSAIALLALRKRPTTAPAPSPGPSPAPAAPKPAVAPRKPGKTPAAKPPASAPTPPGLPARSPVAATRTPQGLVAEAVFNAIETATERLNFSKLKRLNAQDRDTFARFFPKLDLARVSVGEDCYLPANEVNRLNIPGSAGKIKAMTFGNAIYVVGKADRRLILHELVHVDQVRRLGGKVAFARAYGNGVIAGGGTYLGNPLEVEAYGFADKAVAWLTATGTG